MCCSVLQHVAACYSVLRCKGCNATWFTHLRDVTHSDIQSAKEEADSLIRDVTHLYAT